jgi:hypothetical protein
MGICAFVDRFLVLADGLEEIKDYVLQMAMPFFGENIFG